MNAADVRVVASSQMGMPTYSKMPHAAVAINTNGLPWSSAIVATAPV